MRRPYSSIGIESSRRARALWISLLAIVLFVGQIAGSMHAAFQGHRVCEEHGEEIHASQHVEHVAAAHTHATPDDAWHQAHVDPAHDDAAEHEHCLCVLLLRSRFTPFASEALVCSGCAPVFVSGDTQVAERVPSIAGFLLAPKQSPPLTGRA